MSSTKCPMSKLFLLHKTFCLRAAPGVSRELPSSTQHDRDSRHTLPRTHSQGGGSHPQSLGFTGRASWQWPGRECPPALTGSPPASELTGNEEKTAWAAWKSPPGPTPECDSGGLAFKLPSPLSQDPGGPASGNSTAFLHRLRHKSPEIPLFYRSSLETYKTESEHIRWGFKDLLQQQTHFL